MPRNHPRLSPGRWHRMAAAASAALVLALSVLAASPLAHGWMHSDHGPAPEGDGCAVVLFAGGLTAPLNPIVLPRPAPAVEAAAAAPVRELSLVTPRYLRQPERGPPRG